MLSSKRSPRNGLLRMVLQWGKAFQALSSNLRALAGATARTNFGMRLLGPVSTDDWEGRDGYSARW